MTSPELRDVAFDAAQVARICGVPLATLNYWDREGITKRTVRDGAGKAVRRVWLLRDVLVVRAVRTLRDGGVPLQAVRKVNALLAQRGVDLASAHLCWTGSDVVLITESGLLESLLRRPGQQVLHVVVIPLGPWSREVAASDGRPVTVRELRAEARQRAAAQAQRKTRTVPYPAGVRANARR